MTQFEFIAIVISVILGLSIAKLVSGIGDSIRAIKSRSFFWIHGIWVFNILILIAGFWWGSYGWSLMNDWNFLNFLLLLIFTINMYLLSDFLIPRNTKSGFDMKTYFFENRKMFFGILIFTLLTDIFETSLLARTGLRDIPAKYPLVNSTLILLSLIGYWFKSAKIQAFIVIIWGVVLTSYMSYGILFLGT